MENLTLIIPLYNSEVFLPELLEDLTKLSDVRCLFVDDGSTDNTVTLIKRYKKSNWKILFNNHGGPGHSRNTGIENTETRFLMFIDSDDLVNPEELQKIIFSLKRNRSYDIISYTQECETETISQNQVLELVRNVLMVDPSHKYIPAPYSKVFSTDFLKSKNIKFAEDIFVGEDMLFNVSAVLASKNILVKNQSFYYYRNNLSSITNSGSYSSNENWKLFLKELHSRLFKYLPDNTAVKIYQEKMLFLWLDNTYLALMSNDYDKKNIENLRNFFVKHIEKNVLLHNSLSGKQKVFELFIYMKMYKIAKKLMHPENKIRKNFDLI